MKELRAMKILHAIEEDSLGSFSKHYSEKYPPQEIDFQLRHTEYKHDFKVKLLRLYKSNFSHNQNLRMKLYHKPDPERGEELKKRIEFNRKVYATMKEIIKEE